MAPDEDHARAQKADAGNDLCADPQRIRGKVEDFRSIKAHQGGKGRPQANQDMCAHAGGAAPAAPLHADDPTEYGGQQQPDSGRK